MMEDGELLTTAPFCIVDCMYLLIYCFLLFVLYFYGCDEDDSISFVKESKRRYLAKLHKNQIMPNRRGGSRSL